MVEDLSIATTTPDPLSGLVMTMSRRFNCSMASKSVLHGRPVSVLCAGWSSMLQIVGLRPPVLSNHRFRNEAQGSNKPSQCSFSLQSMKAVGERQISTPDRNKPSFWKNEMTICSRYAHKHRFLCSVTLPSSLCECSWPPDSVCF